MTDMVKIDLITGFLGSGKTTFIRKYARYLMEQGRHIGILENDFGAINVDMMLLQDLCGENCELEMVSGGCDRDCHIRRFKTKLIAMGMSGYDRVIVEPSGIFDVDEFFDTLREEPLDQWYEIGNVIAVVDAGLEEELSKEADYLLASEVACAGAIVLSHGDEVPKDRVTNTIAHLNRALSEIQCDRRLDGLILKKSIMELEGSDLKMLSQCGYVSASYRKMALGEYQGFDSLFFMNQEMTKKALEERVKGIFADPACGEVFRIKGFLKVEKETENAAEAGKTVKVKKTSKIGNMEETENATDGEKVPKAGEQWLELNATKGAMSLKPIANGQEVLIVIGEHLNKKAITSYIEGGQEYE